MSQPNSDFGDDSFANAMVEAGPEEGMMEQAAPIAPPPPQYRKQDFSVYSVMLILSFVFLLVAAIMFFIDAGKY